jgi:hypothetical protein
MSFSRLIGRNEGLAALKWQNHNQPQQRSARIRLAIIGVVIVGLAACNYQQPAAHLSPPEVTVSKPVQKDIVDWAEFTGRMAAINFVKITPRVSGYIVDIPFCSLDISGRQKLGKFENFLWSKFFAGLERSVRVMTSENGVIIRSGP